MYTRAVDDHPTIVARNPKHGVLYQVRWDAAPLDGSGNWIETRNLYLLRDANQKWHLIAEGPVVDRGALGASEYESESVKTSVTWTADAKHPVDLTFTLMKKDKWTTSTDASDSETTSSMIICRHLITKTAAEIESAQGLPDGRSEGDISPGAFKRQGSYFVLAEKAESLDRFMVQLSHCCDRPFQKHDGLVKSKEINEWALRAIQKANPSLGSFVASGTTIVLPEGFYYSEDEPLPAEPSEAERPAPRTAK